MTDTTGAPRPRERLYAKSPPSTVLDLSLSDSNYIAPTFPIGPFEKYRGNPIITPSIQNDWEGAFVYNPAAIVFNGKIWLLYRAQNRDLVSCIGLAWSEDGVNFTALDQPILRPTEPWEENGGCEDPRILYRDEVFYLTYTAYDGIVPRLAIATSRDLLSWTKHGILFEDCLDAEYASTGQLIVKIGASKAGAIFRDPDPKSRKYLMLWGEGHMQLAESSDLIHWGNKGFNKYFARGVHPWESRLVEPGPSPIKTKDGKYICFYNCSTLGGGDYSYNQYSVSQMLIDMEKIEQGPIARLEKPCLEASLKGERDGQVANVVFCEGVVQFRGWWMYYGMGDAGIGVATCVAE